MVVLYTLSLSMRTDKSTGSKGATIKNVISAKIVVAIETPTGK